MQRRYVCDLFIVSSRYHILVALPSMLIRVYEFFMGFGCWFFKMRERGKWGCWRFTSTAVIGAVRIMKLCYIGRGMQVAGASFSFGVVPSFEMERKGCASVKFAEGGIVQMLSGPDAFRAGASWRWMILFYFLFFLKLVYVWASSIAPLTSGSVGLDQSCCAMIKALRYFRC